MTESAGGGINGQKYKPMKNHRLVKTLLAIALIVPLCFVVPLARGQVPITVTTPPTITPVTTVTYVTNAPTTKQMTVQELLQQTTGRFVDAGDGGLTNIPAAAIIGSPISSPGLWSGALDLISPLLTATNWAVGAYGVFDQTSKKVGCGIGAIYNITPYAGAWLRGEYNGHDFSGCSGSLALQLPISIIGGKAYLVPLGYTGASVTIAGLGKNNGSPQGIVGLGMAIRYGTHFDLFATYEKRTADNDKLLAGAAWKF